MRLPGKSEMAEYMEPERSGGDEASLLEGVTQGDAAALGQLFALYRPRLRRMIDFRMDRQLRGRIDPSDVLQEAYMDLAKRLPEFGSQRKLSVFVWLRLVTIERLYAMHRVHIGARKRDARRDVSLHGQGDSSQSSILADELIDHFSSVEHKAMRAEERRHLRMAIEEMDDVDREVIAMRIFEGMSNGEVAEALELSKQAASRRFLTAIGRLRNQLESLQGFKSFE